MKKLLYTLFTTVLYTATAFSQGEQRYADGTATDQDGNSFEWINYGTQDWSIENAEVVTYRDGTEIPQVTDDGIWASLTTGAWCYYNNDSSKGKLYNWYAVMGIHDTDPNTPNKEFAPEGWNLPTDAEVTTLEEYLIANGYNYDGTTTGVTTTGNKIGKSVASTTGWESSTNIGAPGNDQSLNNSSGFNAFPYGERNESGLFQSEGSSASFWSSIEGDLDNPFYWGVSFSSTGFGIYSGEGKRFGFLARFVRDVVDTEAPVITLIGESPVSIDQDTTYSDQGATATDNVDGDITANITVTSNVDTSTVGTYTVTYNVSDAAGNAATEVVRTVNVVDTELSLDNTINSTISIYPNPSKGVFTIDFSVNPEDIESVKVFSLSGAIYLEDRNVVNKEYNVDLSNQSKGIYFVSIITKDKQRIVRKLLRY